MAMQPLVQRLRERKLVQWAVAYAAGGAAVWGILAAFSEAWGVGAGVLRAGQVLIVTGFSAALVVAWYDGEKGHLRVRPSEGALLGVVLVVGGVGARWGGAIASGGLDRIAGRVRFGASPS